jgi:hypothetical protein
MERAVISHISRKTSEMWGTRDAATLVRFCSDASLITRELTAIKQFSTKQWEREAKEE